MGALFDRPALLFGLVVIVVLLFGARRLPELAQSVGRSLRIFKAEVGHEDGGRTDPSAAVETVGPTVVPPVSAERTGVRRS